MDNGARSTETLPDQELHVCNRHTPSVAFISRQVAVGGRDEMSIQIEEPGANEEGSRDCAGADQDLLDLDHVLRAHRTAVKLLTLTGKELDALADRMRDQHRKDGPTLRRIK